MHVKGIQVTAQMSFWCALAGVLVLSQLPPTIPTPESAGGTRAHFAAFYILALLAALAFPRRSFFVLGTKLMIVGAVIELAQAILPFNRHASLNDLAVDLIGVMCAFAPFLAFQWRNELIKAEE